MIWSNIIVNVKCKKGKEIQAYIKGLFWYKLYFYDKNVLGKMIDNGMASGSVKPEWINDYYNIMEEGYNRIGPCPGCYRTL